LVGVKGDVADLQGRPLALAHGAPASLLLQGLLMVFMQAGGEQYIHLTAAHGAVEGGGVTQADQVDAAIARPGSPVVGKGFKPLLLVAEGGETVGARAHEAIGQGLVGIQAVGGGRDRGEVDRAEQFGQHGGGPLEAQFQLVAAAGAHAGDAVVEQVAEGADRQEALQAEHHGRRIEGGAVVETHPLAQGNAHREAIAAHLGQGGGQGWLQLAVGAEPVEGITEGAEQLGGAEGGGPHRIHRAHTGAGRHHQAIAAALGLAAVQQGQEQGGDADQACGQPGKQPHRPDQEKSCGDFIRPSFKGGGAVLAAPAAGKFQTPRNLGGQGASGAPSSGCGGHPRR
jgi:hypothetical protein